MKAKNIFNALALAMLMPAMMLTTACSNEDDVFNTENTVKNGYTLPITLNVTRQGDDAATRATFNDGTKKLSFSTGDKLFVNGLYDNYTHKFAGTLTWVSDGTFSGTITTETEYTGTAQELLEAPPSGGYATAYLLPNGYESYGFLSIGGNNGYDDNVFLYLANSFATTKATAVEQFSCEFAIEYDNGFVLSPHCAILNFTITGLSADTKVAVSLDCGSTINSYVTTDGSGNATFAVGVYENTLLEEINLTVGGAAITLGSKTLEAGHIYNITRSAVPAATGHALSASVVGEVVGTDGLAYAVADKNNLPSGVTAAGVVAYKSSTTGQSLVIALADEDGTMDWSTANGASGAAAHTPTVTGYESAWKLPSKTDFEYMCAYDDEEDGYNCSGLQSAITNAGGTALKTDDDNLYWTSYMHGNSFYACKFWSFGLMGFWTFVDNSKTCLVRAVLAF